MLLVVGTRGNTVVLEQTTIEVCTGGDSSGLLRFPIVRRVFRLQTPLLCGLFRATGGGRGCEWVQVCVCGCCLFVFPFLVFVRGYTCRDRLAGYDQTTWLL